MPEWLNSPCKIATCCCQLQTSTGGKTHPSRSFTYSPAGMDKPQEFQNEPPWSSYQNSCTCHPELDFYT